MKHYLCSAHHHPSAAALFSFDQLDAFHCEDVLGLIHGGSWTSVLIIEDHRALLHAFQRTLIGAGPGFDSDPFLGYSGPVSNSNDPGFIKRALARLSDVCRDEGLIAEVLRFNPILENHRLCHKANANLRVVHIKDIVVMSCEIDEEAQLAHYSQSRRRDVARSAGDAVVRLLEGPVDREHFRVLYDASMARVQAAARWRFPAEFFERAAALSRVSFYGAEDQRGQLRSAGMLIQHPLAAYWLLGASDAEGQEGFAKQLVHRMAIDAARRGTSRLILGGGNSRSAEDSLFVWKRRFAARALPFHLGLWVHSPEKFARLTAGSASPYFLSYRYS